MIYIMSRKLFVELKAKCHTKDGVIDYINESFRLCVIIKQIRIKD